MREPLSPDQPRRTLPRRSDPPAGSQRVLPLQVCALLIGSVVATTILLPAQPTWRPAPSNPSPSARHDQTLTFDSIRGNVVMFGGGMRGMGTVNPYGDTWIHDGANWSQRSPANSPSPTEAIASVRAGARGH